MSDRPSDAKPPEPDDARAGEGAERPAADLEPGLFGKLPRSRPGARSPRRRETGARTAPARARTGARKAKADSPASASARAKPRQARRSAPSAPRSAPASVPRAAEREPAPAAGTAAAESGGGIEELAWAGIAVTAEAATLGVRLLSRAIDAARRATERH